MTKQKINPEGVAMPAGPYTNAVRIDEAKGLVFLSGVSITNEKYNIIGKMTSLPRQNRLLRILRSIWLQQVQNQRTSA